MSRKEKISAPAKGCLESLPVQTLTSSNSGEINKDPGLGASQYRLEQTEMGELLFGPELLLVKLNLCSVLELLCFCFLSPNS